MQDQFRECIGNRCRGSRRAAAGNEAEAGLESAVQHSGIEPEAIRATGGFQFREGFAVVEPERLNGLERGAIFDPRAREQRIAIRARHLLNAAGLNRSEIQLRRGDFRRAKIDCATAAGFAILLNFEGQGIAGCQADRNAALGVRNAVLNHNRTHPCDVVNAGNCPVRGEGCRGARHFKNCDSREEPFAADAMIGKVWLASAEGCRKFLLEQIGLICAEERVQSSDSGSRHGCRGCRPAALFSEGVAGKRDSPRRSIALKRVPVDGDTYGIKPA